MNTKDSFRIIGIGASAGGLSAFEAFFTALDPEDKHGTSFVIVQHLSPLHKSMLRDIIQNYTNMDVIEATDKVNVKPHTVYIIPPNKSMTFDNGQLYLFPYKSIPGQDMPIDYFFQSMASALKENAICIIFSGNGTDGTKGLTKVKEAGGITVVQDPNTADYKSMPQSASQLRTVDYQLSPSEIGMNINSIIAREPIDSHLNSNETQEEALVQHLFHLIQNQVGHDFRNYKRNTINRRLVHRMNIAQIDNLNKYIEYLEDSPQEVVALYRDLLIGVTNFFRDAEAFKKLEDVIIPNLLSAKPPGSTVRVWCAGCSTGEEAYSLAILFYECAQKLRMNHKLQIFATDIDIEAVTFARKGLYPSNIQFALSEERLNKYFISEDNGDVYSVRKILREILVFSCQSITKDPPFSHIDFLSCRNLLIYLDNSIQKRIISSFSYALHPKGILFLGNSESIGNNEDLFDTLDRKNKIFQQKASSRDTRILLSKAYSPTTPRNLISYSETANRHMSKQQSLRHIMEQAILKECAIVGALINEKGDILYLHGRLGQFLELRSGEPTINNILSLAKDEFKNELTILIHKATRNMEVVKMNEFDIKIDGAYKKISIQVKPIKSSDPNAIPLFAVLVHEVSKELHRPVKLVNTNIPTSELLLQIEELKTELRIKQEYIESTTEVNITDNEELQSANEEMQSINEELQSTNEELETSEEEMQCINEELTTVNNELQFKVQELSKANNDINNLLSGTNIATIFLDFDLNITRFTPTATEIINLIPTDLGRPITDIVSNIIGYNQLEVDIMAVLDTLIPKVIQVETHKHKWFNMNIQPYRTSDNVVEGVVLTFTDITIIKHLNEALVISELKYRTIFETSIQGIITIDLNSYRIIDVNPTFLQLFEVTVDQLVNKPVWEVDLLNNIVASKEDFIHLEEKGYHRDDSLIINLASGQKINIELISNSINTDSLKLIQWNFRIIDLER